MPRNPKLSKSPLAWHLIASNFLKGVTIIFRIRHIALSLLLASATFANDFTGRHFGVNAGVNFSKTFLGGFYSWDRNQINVGTGFIAASRDKGVYVAQPSITYNRYLNDRAFYASVGILVPYQKDVYNEVREQAALPDTTWSTRKIKYADWRTPVLLAGLGKSFQFAHWGIHLDATFGTELNENFGQKIEPWFGGGLSYRFNLD